MLWGPNIFRCCAVLVRCASNEATLATTQVRIGLPHGCFADAKDQFSRTKMAVKAELLINNNEGSK